MKKIAILCFSIIMLANCKQKTEEVKTDETKIDTPVDSIVPKDTVAETESAQLQTNTERVIKPAESKPETQKTQMQYASFGDKIAADRALTKEQMLQKYAAMKKGDTISVKFKSRISSVCKKKGCWMKMDLPNEKETFVRFRDYGFFVPLNADNSDAIVSGKAFLDVISVDELRHYAKDGGKSQDEIDKITAPKVTYAFQADGVLIAQ